MTIVPERWKRAMFPAGSRGGPGRTRDASRATAACALAAIAAAQLALSTPVQAETFGPGSYSYTVPAGVTRLKVKVAGGGGAAGAIDSTSGPGGAGGGGHVFETILNVTPGQIISGIVGDGGHAGAQGASAPGGIGGAGAGNGGAGGRSGDRGKSGAGGGGGGGTSLALDGTVVLLAGGGGGGQGGSYQSYSAKSGGDAAGLTEGACSASGNGTAGADFSGDGGGGGGGGGGYTGGSGGIGHADRSTGGSASGGGSSCRTSDGSVFAAGPTLSLGTRALNSGNEGPLGFVEITALKPSLTKAFSTASVKKGETFSLTFTLSNPSGAAAQSGLAFTDTLPAGLVLAGAPTASQCGGAVSGTAGGSTISLSGGKLAAGASACTVTATVTTAAAQGPATCPEPATTNSASNVSGLSDNLANGVTDQCVGIRRTALLAKAFGASSIEEDATTTLSFTLTNPAAARQQTGLSFTDVLPNGLVLASAPAAAQCGGTVSGTAGGNSISLSGGSLAPGPSTCTVTATVTTAASQGPAACSNASTTNGKNNITAISTNLANDVTDQCLAIKPAATLTKSFGAASMPKGETVTLTFTLTNPAGKAAVSSLSFTDTLPGGLVLASAPAASQCGGAVSGTAGGSTISLSGGALAAGPAACTVTAMVTTASSQGPASCSDAGARAGITNGSGNITAISSGKLVNKVTDQCVSITPATPTVTIVKVSEGGTGTFVFRGAAASANGFPGGGSYSLTTGADGAAVTGAEVNLSAANATTAIEEALPAGWALKSARCEDVNWQQSGNPRGQVIGSVSDGRTLVIPAENAKAGARLLCTFTNRFVGLNLTGRAIDDNGAGGGTAHNGTRDGGEAGLGGVPVRFTDCGATTYASTVTSGDGTFSLPLAGPVDGASVCVVRGAVAGLVGVSGKPGDTGGTVSTPGYDSIEFTYGEATSYGSILFGLIGEPTLATDGSATVAPGATVFLAHRYAATTSAVVTFGIGNAAGQPDLSGFTYTLIRDADCSGTPEAGEPAVAAAIAVTAGEEVCLVVLVQASPGAATAARLQYDVTADTALSGTLALLATLEDHDVITVLAAGGTITLTKRVRNVTAGGAFSVTSAGAPGDILEYRITFTNPSAHPVSNVSVRDETPAYTSLAVPPGATVAATPAGMSCALAVPAGGGANGYTGLLRWDCAGSMNPGDVGKVDFRVKIAN
ncbi:DUF11 domain-containing protein [Mesorhizobium plurifarium]|uniref:DUF7933 domain-containing protein n=1 Tax=Sinorhizobium arboris TaxID=76745 RepID=UPI00040E6409|nr:DUF11 domain-containing protein [Sinorhizobium arboris]PST27163.1 DUF11 domain-containing protein [Mesorhizobium plurifarium]